MEECNVGDVWRANIRANYKVIAAILGDIFISVIMVMFYMINFGWDMGLFGFSALMAIKPYVIMIVNICSKGELKALQIKYNASQEREKHLRERITWEQEKNTMLSKLSYEREIAEWRVQVAAMTGEVVESAHGATDWVLKNRQIENLLQHGYTNGFGKKDDIKKIAEKNGVKVSEKEVKTQNTTIGS